MCIADRHGRGPGAVGRRRDLGRLGRRAGCGPAARPRVGRDARLIRSPCHPRFRAAALSCCGRCCTTCSGRRSRDCSSGQPHLSWEIAADRVGSAFQLWVPRQVPPGLIERAVTAAWPGAPPSSELEDRPPPNNCRLTRRRRRARALRTGLVPARRRATAPIRCGFVLGQLAGLEDRRTARSCRSSPEPVTVARNSDC